VGAQCVLLCGDQRHEQGVLRNEVLVDDVERHTSLFGDIGDRRSVKPVAREHFLGGRHDLVAAPIGYRGPGAPLSVRVTGRRAH
jgi:hypothetical protein